ncbi:MAG: BsuPI-related putative proteinase inhibitor [Candidatus Margulisiibacteriota bacterium]
MKKSIMQNWFLPIGLLAVVLFTSGWSLAKPYRITLHVDQKTTLSQPGIANVTLRLVVHNVSGRPLSIELRNPPVVFEVYQAGKRIYLSTEGHFYTQVISYREIAAGQQLEITDMVQLEPGMYEAKATLRMKGKSKWIQKTMSTFFEVHL